MEDISQFCLWTWTLAFFVSFLFKFCLMTQLLLFWACSPSCSPFWTLPLHCPPSSLTSHIIKTGKFPTHPQSSTLSLPLSVFLSCEWKVSDWDWEWDSAACYKTLQHLLFIVPPYFHQYLYVHVYIHTHAHTPTMSGLISYEWLICRFKLILDSNNE